jgi:hypothetical protein
MPEISLVVCVYRQRDLLARLLRSAAGVYDDLIVVHDGPEETVGTPPNIDKEERAPAIDFSNLSSDAALPTQYRKPNRMPNPGNIRELVSRNGGRYFEGPRCLQQEPHWPFAWWQAKHDWILRLDADEVTAPPLNDWLQLFRKAQEPTTDVSGYTCIWPLWNGRQEVTTHWPAGRVFLFHKQRVRFFGMVEQVPMCDFRFEALNLRLEHRPTRKSYGLSNLLLRRDAFHWRRVIARSLLGKPTALSHWRWSDESWPEVWEQIRRRPLTTALYRLFFWPIFAARDFWRYERRWLPKAILCGGVHHCLIALKYWMLQRHGERK